MDERPPERDDVERPGITEREVRGPEAESRTGMGAGWLIWVLVVVAIVGALAWYVLTRGEPVSIEMPTVAAPGVEGPSSG